MEHLRCIIADCNYLHRQKLKIQLKMVLPEINLVGEARDGEEAISLIHQLEPEIVLMDIDLPKADGFNVVYRCTDKKFAFVVITSGEQHAYKAIKANAADYILKPVSNKELVSAIDKARTTLQAGRQDNTTNGAGHQARSQTLPVRTGNAYEMVHTEEIVICTAYNNYTEIRLNDRRKFLVSKTLKFYEQSLRNLNFCRIHQSYLVNTEYIQSLEKGRNSHIVLRDGTRLEIAKARKEQVFKILGF